MGATLVGQCVSKPERTQGDYTLRVISVNYRLKDKILSHRK